MDTEVKTITINGVEYVRADSVGPKPNGNRAVVVVDRGWIFAGDVTQQDGRIRITRAVHVFGWESIGFAGMLREWGGDKVDLRPCSDVDMPAGAEIFRIPVANNWGIK